MKISLFEEHYTRRMDYVDSSSVHWRHFRRINIDQEILEMVERFHDR